jgi:hypothetical protein
VNPSTFVLLSHAEATTDELKTLKVRECGVCGVCVVCVCVCVCGCVCVCVCESGSVGLLRRGPHSPDELEHAPLWLRFCKGESTLSEHAVLTR